MIESLQALGRTLVLVISLPFSQTPKREALAISHNTSFANLLGLKTIRDAPEGRHGYRKTTAYERMGCSIEKHDSVNWISFTYSQEDNDTTTNGAGSWEVDCGYGR